MGMLRRIVIGFDGSENSKAAISFIKKIDDAKGAELHLVMVIDFTSLYSYGVDIPESVYTNIRSHSEEQLTAISNDLRSEGFNVKPVILEGSPADAIMEYATKIGAELIVVGSRGLSTFKSILLGSVSAKLVHESKIPVLVVKKT